MPNKQSLQRLLAGLFILLIAVLFFRMLQWDARPLGKIDEAFILDTILRFKQGANIYALLGQFPFNLPCVYTPAYPALCSLLLPLHPDSLFLPRLVSSLSFAASWACVLALFRFEKIDWLGCLVLLATWASGADVLSYASWCRPDLAGFAFTAAGIFIFVKNPRSWWAWVFYGLALSFKQTFLAAPLASILFLAGQDRRLALGRGLAFLGALLVSLAGLQVYSQGEALRVFLKLGGAINQGISGNALAYPTLRDFAGLARRLPETALFFYARTWPKIYYFQTAALAAFLLMGFRQKPRPFLFWYGWVGVAVAGLLLCRAGGGAHYLLDVNLASVLCLAAYWKRVFEAGRSSAKLLFAALALATLAGNLARVYTVFDRPFLVIDEVTPGRLAAIQYLKRYGDPVYSSDAIAAAFSGHPVCFNSVESPQSENAGRLQEWLKQRRFKALCLRFSPFEGDAGRTYRRVKKFGMFEIYEPAGKGTSGVLAAGHARD